LLTLRPRKPGSAQRTWRVHVALSQGAREDKQVFPPFRTFCRPQQRRHRKRRHRFPVPRTRAITPMRLAKGCRKWSALRAKNTNSFRSIKTLITTPATPSPAKGRGRSASRAKDRDKRSSKGSSMRAVALNRPAKTRAPTQSSAKKRESGRCLNAGGSLLPQR